MKKYERAKLFAENEYIIVQHDKRTGPEPLHTHDFLEIVYIESGSATQYVDGGKYPVAKGSLLFINCQSTHAFYPEPCLDYYHILLRPECISEKIIDPENAFALLSLTMFEEFRGIDRSVVSPHFSGSESVLIGNIFKTMFSEYREKKPGSATVLLGYTLIILTHIFRRMFPGSGEDKNLFPDITDFIGSHYPEKLTLPLLAEKSFYSPKYFSKMFKKCYGVTVSDYIQKKRIDEGARLLKETDETVERISTLVGYPDPVHFFRYFKKYYNMTPAEYKKESQ